MNLGVGRMCVIHVHVQRKRVCVFPIRVWNPCNTVLDNPLTMICSRRTDKFLS